MPITARVVGARALLPEIVRGDAPRVQWFSPRGCVIEEGDVLRVRVGGTLIGEFNAKDAGTRNLLAVSLATDPTNRPGLLARAFGMSTERLRQLRHAYAEGGAAALPVCGRGRPRGSRIGPGLRRRLEAAFERGVSVTEAWKKIGRRAEVGRSMVGGVRKVWRERKQAQAQSASSQPAAPIQMPFPPSPSAIGGDGASEHKPPGSRGAGAGAAQEPSAPARADTVEAVSTKHRVDGPPMRAAKRDQDEAAVAATWESDVQARGPRSATSVQHLGTWLMMSLVARHGLHEAAEKLAGGRVEGGALRVALDAAIAALSIGEMTVEGVRRIETPSVPILMRAEEGPSPQWVRRALGRFSKGGGGRELHMAMAGAYVRESAKAAQATPAVFYVDNHLRPYTGKHTLRRGWRMQDKRPRPGATDFYVHDSDGRPLLKVESPANDALTSFLRPISTLLKLALGPGEKFIIAFDRGGSYPEQLAELRDEVVDFVTYERRPFARLTPGEFTGQLETDGETIGIAESRANLGSGRGRVRRVALRMSDGAQVNLLAASVQPAAFLVGVMFGRWSQENGFKHSVERWGINQLDGRKVVAYPPDTFIPNPARRRLDTALRVLKVREGELRCALARLEVNHPERARGEQEIAEVLEQQGELEGLRPATPTHAPLKETELAGKLVHHTLEYKATLDTVRIACANAESDLACELAAHLERPAEAKRTLRNLFNSPGRVRVTPEWIEVTLKPAATSDERQAFHAMLVEVNDWKLTMPGDQKSRPLRFKIATS